MKKLTVLLILLMSTGCTRLAKKQAATNTAIDEKVRENVAAAGLAAQSVKEAVAQARGGAQDKPEVIKPLTRADKGIDLTTGLLARTGALVGAPAQDQAKRVQDLLDENETLRKRAESLEAAKRAEEAILLAEKRAVEAKLNELGVKYEAERNTSIVRRIIAWAFGTLGIAGVIVLVCLFPALLPILGQVFGWIVGAIPQIAGFLGVVSTKAVNGIVVGVERAKAKMSAGNVEVIESELSKAMDRPHKNLVKARKVALADLLKPSDPAGTKP